MWGLELYECEVRPRTQRPKTFSRHFTCLPLLDTEGSLGLLTTKIRELKETTVSTARSGLNGVQFTLTTVVK